MQANSNSTEVFSNAGSIHWLTIMAHEYACGHTQGQPGGAAPS